MSRRAKHGNSSLDLVKVVVTREKRRATQQLGEDAADGPDVKSIRIMRGVQDDLRCTVLARHDVLGERRGGLLVATSQTEIANLEVAVLIEK